MCCAIPTCAASPSGPVDLTRLIHYTIITDKGFTIHKTGLPALQMFLNTRMYLIRTSTSTERRVRSIFICATFSATR